MNLPLLGTFEPNFNFGDFRAFWAFSPWRKGEKFLAGRESKFQLGSMVFWAKHIHMAHTKWMPPLCIEGSWPKSEVGEAASQAHWWYYLGSLILTRSEADSWKASDVAFPFVGRPKGLKLIKSVESWSYANTCFECACGSNLVEGVGKWTQIKSAPGKGIT